MEHVNKVMKIRGGLKGLIKQLAAMAQWFLVAQAEDMVGVQRASSSHHDLSDAVMNCYNENVEKLKDVLKAKDPFATADSHLVNNIIINNNKKGSYCAFKILNALTIAHD